MKVRAALLGKKELQSALADLGAKAFRQAARKGVDDATKLVVKGAKAQAPERTKALQKSIGRKVVAKKSKTGYLGVVGPRRDKKGAVLGGTGKTRAKFRRKVSYQGREIVVDPAKYAHLVEGGRRPVRAKTKRALSDGTAIFGRSAKGVPPRPFMRTAWQQNRDACAAAIKARLKVVVLSAAKRPWYVSLWDKLKSAFGRKQG